MRLPGLPPTRAKAVQVKTAKIRGKAEARAGRIRGAASKAARVSRPAPNKQILFLVYLPFFA